MAGDEMDQGAIRGMPSAAEYWHIERRRPGCEHLPQAKRP